MKKFEFGEIELNYLRKKDKKLGQAIDRIDVSSMVLRFIEPNLFANLIRSIIGQQISSKAAETVYKRFEETFVPMTPDNILKYSQDDIQKLGVSFRKVEYIRNSCQIIVNGKLNLNSFHDKSDDDIIKELIQLPGVGKWTAEMLLIFSLGRPDVVSFGDLAILRGMCNLYGHKKITKELFEKYRKRYSPYGTVASFYLWELS